MFWLGFVIEPGNRRQVMKASFLVFGAAAMVAACAHTATELPFAKAVLQDANGRTVGEVTLQQQTAGLRLSLRIQGLSSGTHGVHVHAVGKCEAPGFTSAGSHWNPTSRQHGKDNPAGMHRGDLPNLIVDGGGHGSLDATIDGASLADLLDADGAAIVVHAAADDYKTDPSGNSGARIACGVLNRL
jgi:Cu-Zn family superoxide dismutase